MKVMAYGMELNRDASIHAAIISTGMEAEGSNYASGGDNFGLLFKTWDQNQARNTRLSGKTTTEITSQEIADGQPDLNRGETLEGTDF